MDGAMDGAHYVENNDLIPLNCLLEFENPGKGAQLNRLYALLKQAEILGSPAKGFPQRSGDFSDVGALLHHSPSFDLPSVRI